MILKEYMLTTIDNPFDPFTEFDEWLAYDQRLGHFTLEFLGRIVRTSNELSEFDQRKAVQDAIDEIVSYNITGLYKKVLEPRHRAA